MRFQFSVAISVVTLVCVCLFLERKKRVIVYEIDKKKSEQGGRKLHARTLTKGMHQNIGVIKVSVRNNKQGTHVVV